MTALPRPTALTPIAIVLLMLLVACTSQPPAPSGLPSSVRPTARPDLPKPEAQIRRERAARAAAAAAIPVSQDSRRVRDYLGAMQTDLITRGLLRTESASEDSTLTVEQLTENFIQIALRDEYRRENGQLVPSSHPAPLRRWDSPVRLQLEFGASVSPGARSRIRNEVSGFAARLQAASRHPVALVTEGGNFTVFVLNEDERRRIGPRLQQLVPGVPVEDITAIQDLPMQNYCTVFAYSRGAAPVYVQAVAVLRAELPLRLETSCIHEELAQGMGLANDSPAARPSIFNDDEEFAYLTRHDELLLRMLYDPRMRPGMTDDEARPIARIIAAELLAPLTN